MSRASRLGRQVRSQWDGWATFDTPAQEALDGAVHGAVQDRAWDGLWPRGVNAPASEGARRAAMDTIMNREAGEMRDAGA